MELNVQSITISQIKAVIEHVAIAQNETVMIVGPAGSGKTAGIYQAADALNLYLEPARGFKGTGLVLLSQYDTVDLRGTPWLAKLGKEEWKSTVWHPASTLPFVGNPNFPDDQDILLFFDETTSATVPVMGNMYQLVHQRRLGEHLLKPRVRIVCAGNREQDRGIVNRMPLPLCNRMTWFEAAISAAEWSQWAIQKYGDKAAIFAAFLGFREQLISTYDPAKPEKVFASPRTIEMAVKYWSSTMPHDIKLAAISGCVGDGWLKEFESFVKVWQQVGKMMKEIPKNPSGAPIPGQHELAMRYAVAVSISGSMNVYNVHAYDTYLKRMDTEYNILAWQLATARDPSLLSAPEYVAFTLRYKAAWAA
jgi:hypothetical protein